MAGLEPLNVLEQEKLGRVLCRCKNAQEVLKGRGPGIAVVALVPVAGVRLAGRAHHPHVRIERIDLLHRQLFQIGGHLRHGRVVGMVREVGVGIDVEAAHHDEVHQCC